MAQHDYVIANGTGAAVRSDLNNGLAAIVSNNSGATEPATMYAYQWWADTTTGLLKLRNSANSAWISLRELDGTLTIEDGTAAAPGLAFTSDLNTGLVRVGADQLAISTGGTSRLAVSTTAVSSTLAVDVPLGAVGTPSLTFTGDLNTGIYSPGADQLAVATGGVQRINIEADGDINIDGGGVFYDATNNRLAIGTTSPQKPLHISTSDNVPLYVQTSNANCYLQLQNSTGLGYIVTKGNNITFDLSSGEKARLDPSGRLLVGTSSGNANGGILQLTSGITFPATAVAASDANTLDDYEEGTWTGTDGSGAGLSITFVGGRYTKIGRLVYVSAETITYPVTASTATATLGGLPFTNGPQNAGAAALITTNLNANRSLVEANTTTASFYPTSSISNSTNAQLSSTTIYAFSAVYQI